MANPMEQPGLLFVIATLLPLLSFALLILLAAVRWGLRPYAKNNAKIDMVFQALGGEVPGHGPAYVALTAIALAFACSLTGFIVFLTEVDEMHHLKEHLTHVHGDDTHDGHADEHKEPGAETKGKVSKGEAKAKKSKGEVKSGKGKKPKAEDPKKIAAEAEGKKAREKKDREEDEKKLAHLEHRWQAKLTWARIAPASSKDLDRATTLEIGFRIDMLSAIMFVMVTFIATMIHLFSMGYMTEELHATVEDHEIHTAHGHYHRRGRFGRFFMFLSLFCFSMLNLLAADNLFQVFVSWELVGLCSFLLVGFYFERTSASNAANKAFIVNRVGDAGFIIGLMIVWTYFGTFNFEEIFSRLRSPGLDAHGPILVHGEPAQSRIIRGNVGEKLGYTFAKLDKHGDAALIFPRKSGHFHGPSAEQKVFAEPAQNQYGYIPYWMLVAAGLGIFLGCIGKSAQFPLQVWLPDAMEGPTPVSALIHAATMVAAGVYLVGRCHQFFTPEVLLTISYVGAITLFVAAAVAVVMTDIKKVLAYSTVSQLGYMMLGLGVGGTTAGLLHLLTHAFFKSLLFLGSGSVIYGCHHQQDMLKMGGLYSRMKITAITMLIGVLAISGIPLFSGWYSKDEILVSALGFSKVNEQHFLLFLLPLATAGITTFYMFRMWLMTFTGKPRDHEVHAHAHESPWMMTVPLILLAILSVSVAWGWPLHEAEESYLGKLLHHHHQPASVGVDFAAESKAGKENHVIAGALALGAVGVGLAFALLFYFYKRLDPAEAKEQFPGVHRFLSHKWYFDELYSAAIVRPGMIVAGWCRNFDLKVIDGFLHGVARGSLNLARWSGRFDKGIVDGVANLIADVSYDVGIWLRHLQTGYLRNYVLCLALAAMSIWILLYAWASALGSP